MSRREAIKRPGWHDWILNGAMFTLAAVGFSQERYTIAVVFTIAGVAAMAFDFYRRHHHEKFKHLYEEAP